MNRASEHIVSPLVSIAMASYNGAAYLQLQLESLLQQTYPNIEIIISDDHSTDDTADIVARYQQKHAHIHWFVNKGQPGIRSNFDNALQHCSGRYIALCDQDDIWMDGKITSLVDAIGGHMLIYHNSLFVDDNGQSLETTVEDIYHCYAGSDPMVFLLDNCISGHACLFKRELLQLALPFPDARYHDWWLSFVAAANGGIQYLPEVLVHYRQHQKSKTDILERKKAYQHAGASVKFRQELEWYERCAKIPGTEQPFYEMWKNEFAKTRSRLFNWKLFSLVLGHKKRLFYISKNKQSNVLIEAIKIATGLQVKKWFN